MSVTPEEMDLSGPATGSPPVFTAAAGADFAAGAGGYGASSSGAGGLSFGEARAEAMRNFRITAANHARERGINSVTSDWNLVTVAEEAGINLFHHTRDAEFLASIWIAFLTVMKEHFPPDQHKFPNVDAFLEAYPEFQHTPAEEQTNLFNTANWMAVLFTMIPAAKNKGLVLQVIPQLVEGGHVKYITGSGQTEATASRVHIYEKEGHIVITHRSGGRSYKKKNAKKQSTKKAPAPVTGVFRRPRSGSESSVARRREAHAHRLGDPLGEHTGARRPRSGTGSSSTDGEFEDYHFGEGMDDDAEGASDEEAAGAAGGDYTIAEEEEEESDFADVLQLLRSTSAGGRGRGSMALQQPPAPDFYASLSSSSGLISPDSPGLGLTKAVPLERINSWGGMVGVGPGPLQRYSSTEFPDQPAFPPEHPSYHPVVDQLGVAVMGRDDNDLFFPPGKKS